MESGGSDGWAEDQTKFPTAAKGEAGRAAAAAPGGRSRIARGSGRAGFLLKFRFGASFTRISRTNRVPRLGRKRCLPPWTNPHSLRAFAEQSCEVLPGPGRWAEGQYGSGGGEGSADRAPSSPRRRVEGRCGELPFPAFPDSLLSPSIFYCGRSILPEVNSTKKSLLFSRQWLL